MEMWGIQAQDMTEANALWISEYASKPLPMLTEALCINTNIKQLHRKY